MKLSLALIPRGVGGSEGELHASVTQIFSKVIQIFRVYLVPPDQHVRGMMFGRVVAKTKMSRAEEAVKLLQTFDYLSSGFVHAQSV